jgi:hypothetical protein
MNAGNDATHDAAEAAGRRFRPGRIDPVMGRGAGTGRAGRRGKIYRRSGATWGLRAELTNAPAPQIAAPIAGERPESLVLD